MPCGGSRTGRSCTPSPQIDSRAAARGGARAPPPRSPDSGPPAPGRSPMRSHRSSGRARGDATASDWRRLRAATRWERTRKSKNRPRPYGSRTPPARTHPSGRNTRRGNSASAPAGVGWARTRTSGAAGPTGRAGNRRAGTAASHDRDRPPDPAPAVAVSPSAGPDGRRRPRRATHRPTLPRFAAASFRLSLSQLVELFLGSLGDRVSRRAARKRLLITVHRAGDIALREAHIAKAEECGAHDVRRCSRSRRAPEPILRVARSPVLERHLSRDERAEPQPFPRRLDYRRRAMPADDPFKDTNGGAAVSDPDKHHPVYVQ